MSLPPKALPDGTLVSWYGDDFTGAAAVMEVLTLAGLPSVLFCDIPTPELLDRFSGLRGIGIASVARSKSPQWMEQHLPPAFQVLARLRAPIAHYKVCSTLDSAPHVGSIGKAIDLGTPLFRSSWVPLLPAAPAIHRYQAFGNLFAAVRGTGYRLDRHPTMSRHPVTPMTEADVRIHLGGQTDQSIGLVDFVSLKDHRGHDRLKQELQAGHKVVAIDTVDETSLIAAGELLWDCRGEGLFAVGSQGVEYALVAYWRSTGLLRGESPMRTKPVERIAVVSGSCSPVTAQQIDWAVTHGFEPIKVDVCAALDERAWGAALSNALRAAIQAVECGRDPLVFSARGPEDPAIAAFSRALNVSGNDPQIVNERIGHGLGKLLDTLLKETGIRRGVFAGGDTSGYGARALGIQAFTLLAPTVPGAGLFRAYSQHPHYPYLEIALKGGQMGAIDYFGQIKNGGVMAAA